jgi:hypothetical protein
MSDEDEIDKAIDEAINKVIPDQEEVKKRKPKPFRYLTDSDEIKAELSQEKVTPPSVMKSPDQPKIIENDIFIVGMGDIETIENIIRKHEMSRKFKD